MVAGVRNRQLLHRKRVDPYSALVHDEAENTGFRRADFVLVTRDPQALMRDPIRGATSLPKPIAGLQPWTDDFNNLFGVLK